MAKGDHIYVEYFPHEHHGIDCGDGTVIHYSKSGEIKRISKSEFAAKKTIKYKNYEKKFSPDKIVKRAEARLGEKAYDLLFNNCESFAYYCTSGESDSWQINHATVTCVATVATVATVPVTTTVSVGGILGFFGATTTTIALGPTVLVGGALWGLGYLAVNSFSKLDDK